MATCGYFSHHCRDTISEQRRLGLVCAEHISLAIANVKLRDQSIHDALTGLYNRRYLLETCRREFSRATLERSSRVSRLFKEGHTV